MSVKLIYGPPGIGKSTLIRELQLSGKRALDLEILDGSMELRKLAASVAIGLGYEYIAMADVPPSEYLGPSVKKVLLYMPEAKYQRRRSYRDRQQPWKASQQPHSIEEWKGKKLRDPFATYTYSYWDFVVDVQGPPWDAVYALMGLDRIL